MAARYSYYAPEDDFLSHDPDPGSSSSSSDSESDCELDSVEELKSNPQPVRSGLKIIIPPRKRGSAVIAARNVAEDWEEEDTSGQDYEADEDEDASPTKYRKVEYTGAPSPLSTSSQTGAVPVYTGYRCQIANCNFKASTAQHLRHHMATAQHSRALRSAYAGPA
ncbi:hypothetical protein NM688_g2192 [Phlebia brevispora]|uniref:Uncharacterized protein n=1 Tax=Phlebia brevispora TaxID=194682 RepID=A0ACC1T9Z9_9APHY|nr:hypothetical protein NM688_g2192 [Phlebia brevispora]